MIVALAPGAARADWRRAESDHFIVYGRSEKAVREYAAMLEDFDGLLRRLHGRPKDEITPRKLPVYLVADLEQMRRVAPQLKDNTAGVYFTAVTEVFALAARSSDDRDQNLGDDTAMHEYVHHFMMQYYPSAYPAWLVEGYAEYYMTADLAPKRLVVGGFNRGRAYSLTAPGLVWIPMQDLLNKRPGDLGKWETQSYYAQAWLLTHYILSDPERYKLLSRYLNAVREGRDGAVAWREVYGDDPEGLRRKLRAYMDRPLPAGMLPRTEPLNPPMTVTVLSPGADALMLEGQRLKLGVPPADQPAFLTKIRAVAAKLPEDRFARLVLARAETQYGDRAAGEAILDALLAADPKDEEALIALGESRFAAGVADPSQRAAYFAQAGKLFARAFKINPDNPQTLHGYADSRSLEPLTENIVNTRLRAMLLAPQVGHLRVDAARALIATRDFDTARTVLTPLASSPHGGGDVEAARGLLKSLPPEVPSKAAGAAKPEGDKKG